MKTQIQQVGNTLAVSVPEIYAEEIHLKQGTIVDVSVIDDKLVVACVAEEGMQVKTADEELLGTKMPPPFRVDPGGAIRIGNTRVTLATLIAAYTQGASAERIVEVFPGLILADVYAAISYYLQHKESIDPYLQQQAQFAEEFRQHHPEIFDNRELRKRALNRRAKQDMVTHAETVC